jgi:hypothetical protein
VGKFYGFLPAGGGAGPRAARKLTPRIHFAAAIVAFAAALVFWFTRTSPTDMTVTAVAGASYSRTQEGARDVVRLHEGAFDFDIHSHDGKRPLLFVVPDGEIEDIGTRFHVVVRGEHTEEIAVTEGEIEFRRVGAPPMRLVAGMTYRRLADEAIKTALAPAPREPSPAAPPHADVTPPASPGATPPHASTVVSPSPSVATRPTVAPSHTPTPTGATSGPTPAGPQTSPIKTGLAAEDIAYMEVVRLLRSGRDDEAHDAARRWLLQYPSGLRRAEVARIAAGTGP